ncbi:MAG TPA: hypothetical protein VKA84_05150 [Gemmatimonadaceae bacterium]|nr:hypothetical protein [Gemmatimonadaceae bacterium]
MAARAALAMGAVACSRNEAPSAVPSDSPALDGSLTTTAGVTYSAETLVLESFPVQLRTIVTATNTGSEPVRLTSDGCEAFVVAHRAAGRAGPPTWDQRKVWACTRILKVYDIGPGHSVKLQTQLRATDILGDSLPSGRYYLSAIPGTDHSVTVRAGDVQLDRPGSP